MKAPVCGSFDSDADPFRQWSAVAVPVAASMASHYVWVRTETVESNACPLSGVRDSDLNGRYAARLRPHCSQLIRTAISLGRRLKPTLRPQIGIDAPIPGRHSHR